jgi:hypothetical protein
MDTTEEYERRRPSLPWQTGGSITSIRWLDESGSAQIWPIDRSQAKNSFIGLLTKW